MARIAAAFLICSLVPAAAQEPQVAEPAKLFSAAQQSYASGQYAQAVLGLGKVTTTCRESKQTDALCYEAFRLTARALTATGKYDEAEKALQDAILWRESTTGPDNKALVGELLEVSRLCRAQKAFDRALAAVNRVMGIHMQGGIKEPLEVADDYARIGQIYDESGQPSFAVGFYFSALNTREIALGSEHPALLPDLDRMGETYVKMQEYQKAEASYRRAVLLREKLFGPESQDLLQCVDGLAYSLFGLKRYEEAEAVYMRSLALWTAATTVEHPMVAMTMEKIAVFYRAQEKEAQAKIYVDKALALRSIFHARGLAAEGAVQGEKNNLPEATRLLRQAISELDPQRTEHTELLATFQKIAKTLAIDLTGGTVETKSGRSARRK